LKIIPFSFSKKLIRALDPHSKEQTTVLPDVVVVNPFLLTTYTKTSQP